MSTASPVLLRRAPAPRGFTLMEMLLVVAILGVIASLSAAALVPLQAHFRSRDAATRVASAALRARVGAWQTGRCHLLTVHNGATPVASGVPGDRLLVQRRSTADCESTVPPEVLEDVEWVLMPERVTVWSTAGAPPVWLSNGRMDGSLVELRVQAGSRERSIQLAPTGAVCVGDVPAGACP